MIGGITKGSCFSGCVEYVLALKEENKEARLLYSVSGISTVASSIGADTSLYPIRRRIRHGFQMKPW